MNRRSPLLVGLLGIAAAGLVAAAQPQEMGMAGGTLTAQQQTICRSALDQVPHFRASLLARTNLKIVALGSSSTYGLGASQPSLSFVNVFSRELAATWHGQTEVINRGVSGDVLKSMIARAPRDVYALHPDVVILQSGTNDVLRKVPVALYRQQLQEFVGDLVQHGIAVVLVDNQYLPSVVQSPEYQGIQQDTRSVAGQYHLPLVSRERLSQALFAGAQLVPNDIVAADGLHPNDRMHACTAQALTATFAQALEINPNSGS